MKTQKEPVILLTMAGGIGCAAGACAGPMMTVNVRPEVSGHLSVGGVNFPLQEGCARLRADRLPDGVLEVSLLTVGGRVRCDRLFKEGDHLRPAPLTDDEMRKIRERCFALETQVRTLTDALAALEKSVRGESILTFG